MNIQRSALLRKMFRNRRVEPGIRRGPWVCALLIMWASWLGASVARCAEDVKAGAPHDVVVGSGSERFVLRFRYCPPGKLRPGPPRPPSKAKESGKAPAAGGGFTLPDSTIAISPFYLSETEITYPQFGALVGPARVQDLSKRIKKYEMVAKMYEERYASGKDYPVMMVTVEDTVDACKQVSLKAETAGHDEITATRFRLPTHDEWQYACRAQADPDAKPPRPHFHSWPEGYDALDKNVRGKCEEVWGIIGNGEAFTGSQEQVAAMLSASLANDHAKKPLEILSAFLKAGIGTDREYAKGLPGAVKLARASRANDWGLFDMHENACEWVLSVRNAEVEALWRELTDGRASSASFGERKVFGLAGGAYNRVMTDSDGEWKKFTIWGGPKMDNAKTTILPYTFDGSGSDSDPLEYEPGFRIAMTRVLADGWLMALRREVVPPKEIPSDVLARLEAKRNVALGLVTNDRRPSIQAKVAFYEALAHYRMGRLAEAGTALAKAQKDLIEAPAGASSRRLRSLFGNREASTTPKPEEPAKSDDASYFEALSLVMSREG